MNLAQAKQAMDSVGVTSLDAIGLRGKRIALELTAALRQANGPLGTAIDLGGNTIVCVIVVKEEDDGYHGFYM